jgi:hypothetical protein
MLQANPSLTPNAVKAILQYTAQVYSGYDALTQGAGFLNAAGAVALSQYFAAPTSTSYPTSSIWSRRIVWGNELLRGGRLTPTANAWTPGLTWGSPLTPGGQNVQWGVVCSTATCKSAGSDPWQTACLDSTCGTVQWGVDYFNAVWGPLCGGADCEQTWTPSLFATTGATADGDTVVWGTMSDGDTVVWGTAADADTVVWGTNSDGDTVVWGTNCSDPSCDTVIWSNKGNK